MTLYGHGKLVGGPHDIFMEKTAKMELPKEIGKWGAALHSWLKEEYPYLDRYAINITFKSVDEDRGYGVGSATVARGFSPSRTKDGKTSMVPVGPYIHIPFVVDSFKPMEVKAFSDGKRYRVLNERNVAASMSGPDGAYKKVQKQTQDSASGENFFSPPDRAWEESNGTRTSPVMKIGSIQPTESERETSRKFGRWLQDPEPSETHVGSVVERTGTNFIVHDVFEKNGSLSYQRVELTYPEAASQGLEFRRGTYKALVHRDSEFEITKSAAAKLEEPVLLKEGGGCYVYKKDGTPVTGVLVTEVTELDGSRYPGSLLMTKEGFAIGHEFYGGPTGITPEINDVHSAGGMYTFIRKNAAIAPIYVDSWEGDSFKGRDMLGRSFIGCFGDVKNPVEIREGEYLFPKHAACVPLGEAIPVLANPRSVVEETIAKESRVSYDGQRFFMADTEEYMDEGKTRAYLAAYGADPTDAEVVIKTAKTHGMARFYPVPFEKKAAIKTTERVLDWVDEEVISTMAKGVRMIKEAGLADDSATVDNILDLQFVTPDNIRMFTDQIEQYNDTVSNLCQLSLGSQLGANVDGSVAIRAAEYLDKVVHQLGQQRPFTETQ